MSNEKLDDILGTPAQDIKVENADKLVEEPKKEEKKPEAKKREEKQPEEKKSEAKKPEEKLAEPKKKENKENECKAELTFPFIVELKQETIVFKDTSLREVHGRTSKVLKVLGINDNIATVEYLSPVAHLYGCIIWREECIERCQNI